MLPLSSLVCNTTGFLPASRAIMRIKLRTNRSRLLGTCYTSGAVLWDYILFRLL